MQLKMPEDKRVIRALIALRYNDDFRLVMQFLKDELQQMRENGDTMDGDFLKWNQGKCQFLKTLLQLPKDAGTIFKNFK